jgi:hypothetical protein
MTDSRTPMQIHAEALAYMPRLRLAYGERVTDVIVTGSRVDILVDACKHRETAREMIITHSGMRRIRLACPTGTWIVQLDKTTWFELDAPVVYPHHSVGRAEVTRYQESMRDYRECYRPGTSRDPRDSHYRMSLGYTSH